MNYVLYFYQYERIFLLLLTNNSGIDGAESKKDSDPRPLMNQSHKSTYNKTSSYKISSRIRKH